MSSTTLSFVSPAPFVDRETALFVEGGVGRIETVATAPVSDGVLSHKSLVAVVCHPHPLHGGTMDNKVVTTLVRCYRDLGVPVVRFNFRGVGASEGVFDNGVGEAEDTSAVIEWARRCYPEAGLLLAGFSFGSAVAAKVSHQLSGVLQHLVLVAPPVERYDYDKEGCFVAPSVVIMGDQDELVDAKGVYNWQQQLKSTSVLLRYSAMTHFFHGGLAAFKKDLAEQLAALA